MSLQAVIVLIAATFLGVVSAAPECDTIDMKAKIAEKYPGLGNWDGECKFTMRVAPARMAKISFIDNEGIEVSGPRNSKIFITQVKQSGFFLAETLYDGKNEYKDITDRKEKSSLIARYEISQLPTTTKVNGKCYGVKADSAKLTACADKRVVEIEGGTITFEKTGAAWEIKNTGKADGVAKIIESDNSTPINNEDVQLASRLPNEISEKKISPAAAIEQESSASVPDKETPADNAPKITKTCGSLQIFDEMPEGTFTISPHATECNIVVPMAPNWKAEVVLDKNEPKAFIYGPNTGDRRVAEIQHKKIRVVQTSASGGDEFIDDASKVSLGLKAIGILQLSLNSAALNSNCKYIGLGNQETTLGVCKKQVLLYASTQTFKIMKIKGAWHVKKFVKKIIE